MPTTAASMRHLCSAVWNGCKKKPIGAYEQLHFQLFGCHAITSATFSGQPQLTNRFAALEEKLHSLAYDAISRMDTNELADLYIRIPDKQRLIAMLIARLNADPQFSQALHAFYADTLAHLGQSQRSAEQQQLAVSLGTTITASNKTTQIISTQQDSSELLKAGASRTLNTDSAVLLGGITSAVDAVLLTQGVEDTRVIIASAEMEKLALILNLPYGTLTAQNHRRLRDMLIGYVNAKNAQLTAITGAAGNGLGFGGMAGAVKNKSLTTEKLAKHLEPVRALQTTLDSMENGADMVVETDKSTIKQKKEVFYKMYAAEWNALRPHEQAAIYAYYGKAITQGSLYQLIPDEFYEFRGRSDYAEAVGELGTAYEKYGKLNPGEFAQHVSEASSLATVAYYTDAQRLAAEFALYNYEQLTVAQQQLLAQEAHFTTVEAYKEALLADLQTQFQVEQYAQAASANEQLLMDFGSESGGSAGGSFAAANSSPFSRIRGLAGARNSKALQAGQSLARMAKNRLGKQAVAQGAATAAKVGLGATGVGLLAAGGLHLLQSKQGREIALAGGTWLTAQTLYAYSTWGGLLGGIGGGILGFLAGGPLGAVGGSLAGAHTGAHLIPAQWSGFVGLTPRQAPGLNLHETSDPLISPDQASLESMRSGTPANIGGGIDSMLVSPESPQALSANLSAAQPLPVSTTAAGAGALTSTLLIPALAIAGPVLMSLMVLTVIFASLLVPVPTNESEWGVTPDEGALQQSTSKFVTIQKTASPAEIANNTPTTITYTVSVAPKDNYHIKITNLTDTFSIHGTTTPTPPASPFNNSYFTEIITSPTSATYEVSNIGAGTVDAFVTNQLIITFDVYDQNGYAVQQNENYRTSAQVKVGSPKVGCWPSSGKILQTPEGTFSHNKNGVHLDSFDIYAPYGAPIYAPYSESSKELIHQAPKYLKCGGMVLQLRSPP
jgi:hypothetical protein